MPKSKMSTQIREQIRDVQGRLERLEQDREIECDGATYHSAKSIRDRDILRQRILAAYSALDREGEARRQAEELLRLDPGFSVAQIGRFYAMKVKAEIERFIDDLRKGGLK